jgi:hypothetical protein
MFGTGNRKYRWRARAYSKKLGVGGCGRKINFGHMLIAVCQGPERRGAVAAGEENSADAQRGRANITGFI